LISSYLRNNPTASVDIIGHADELGRLLTMTNCLMKELHVKKILMKANIDASRLNVIAAGEDNSVEKIQN
jgi:OOP family OmpA-OmpF porin